MKFFSIETPAIEPTTLEMIDVAATSEEVDGGVALPILTIQADAESSINASKDGPIELINLANPNSLQFQNILANGELEYNIFSVPRVY